MTKNNGSFVPSDIKMEVYGNELYQKTNSMIDTCQDKNIIAVLSTLRGVIALQIGIYRELKKNK